MSRRKRPFGTPPKPLDAVFTAIDAMERNVVGASVRVDFDLMGFIKQVLPPTTIEKLRVAHTVVDVNSWSTWSHWDGAVEAPCGRFHYRVGYTGLRALDMALPKDGLGELIDPDCALVRAVGQIKHIRSQHDKVRQVARWLNEHATIGAAKAYCPSLGSLLPPTHDLNTTQGVSYREPSKPIGEILPVLREVPTIIAAGLLAPPRGDTKNEVSIGVTPQVFFPLW